MNNHRIPLYYDLHLHTCLSPCGDIDMTPANVVGMASLLGLQVIAITDHNSCKNCEPAMKHGETYGITVIPGMELTTAEDVHVVCLFETLEDAMRFDTYVYEHMLPIPNRPDIFGEQLILDVYDQTIGEVENLLISATDISYDDCFDLVASFRGIVFPSHLDRSSNNVISNLGFIPPDSKFTCAELYDLKQLHRIREANPYLEQCRILSNSDAHNLEAIRDPKLQLYAKSRSIRDVLSALTERQL